ncbi:putative ribonuclease H-like domain-containing protein, partial [Tanacetum coccineum]
LIVTPLFDVNEDECFDPEGDIDEIDAFLDIDVPMDIKDDFHDFEGDIIYLESFLNEDTIPNLPPEIFLDRHSRSLKDELNNDELKSIIKVFDPEICDKIPYPTYVKLFFEDRHYLSFTYVIRIFLPYFTYPVESPFLLSSGSEDIIFDPGIFAYSYYSLEQVVPIHVTAPESGPSTALKKMCLSNTEEKICKKSDVKARSLLLMALPNEHQLTFNHMKTLMLQAQNHWILSLTGFKACGVKIEIPGLDEQTHIDTMRFWMNLYNNFKNFEQKVKRIAAVNNDDKNLAFLTTSSLSSTNTINTVNTGVSTGTTKVNTASTETSTASFSDATVYSFSDATVYAFLSTQPQGSQLVHEDLEPLHDDDLEEIDLKWNMALLSMRARKFYHINWNEDHTYSTKSKDNKNWYQEMKFKQTMALMAFTDSEVSIDKSCSKSCLNNYEALKKQYDLLIKLDDIGFKAATYKRGLSILEAQVVKYKEFEVFFSEEIALLKRSVVAKATSEESMLWHRRLGHINFNNINKFVKENLVRDLPLKRFENDQTCVACLKGKQHRASCKTKAFNPITKPLFMLHMDLFGPTFDETSEILKNFIKEVENLVDKKVKIIRSDNGTEFKNKVMDDFCREKGIKREYSVARTPQQNGVAERKNRTLIEAARTMLADSKLPTTFWAEAVSTACYVQNRVLIVKPHNKTPCELFRGFKPSIGFMKPFGCHVTILNTLDKLGKFDGKSDEGFFVGYSLSSKAFRVYNIRTRKVQENLHIGFLENKPMIEGNGPKWLFDLDSLTQSMNYVPVVAGKSSNDFAGIQGVSESSTSSQQDQDNQDCIVMPIWKDASYFDVSSPKSVADT